MKLPHLLLFALAACSPPVNIGSDEPADYGECEYVARALVECPAMPWGAPRSFATLESLEQRLVGRWAFCGGEKRYTGRGPLLGFSHGTGVEFWSEAGQLHYAFLSGRGSGLARTQDDASAGTVRLLLDNGRGRAVLASGDGQEVSWNVDFFEGQVVLQNGAFDVWNFVPVE